MITALVGYTGFVGSNLAASRRFDFLYNSKNIQEAYDTKPDLLVYAGVPAAKFLANSAPEKDREVCLQAYESICKIQPKELVLISTVDVYQAPFNVDENTVLDTAAQPAYGKNRAELESLVHKKFPNATIIRLPALFGGGLKKNFLFDMLTIAPAMLSAEKYAELSALSELVRQGYTRADNGYYTINVQDAQAVASLKEWFAKSSFNALSFTDSRAQFQFYNLINLWRDIAWAQAGSIRLVNFTSEPITAAQIYSHVTKGGVFTNELANEPPKYDIRTKYYALYAGENGYMYNKHETLDGIAEFMRNAQSV